MPDGEVIRAKLSSVACQMLLPTVWHAVAVDEKLINPMAKTLEPLGVTECPVPLTDPNIGNGLCEDLYNVAACGFDGGDW